MAEKPVKVSWAAVLGRKYKPNYSPDWKEIEQEYRAGQLSNKIICKLYGIAEPTLIARAKKYHWDKDLSYRVNVEIKNRLTDPQYAADTPEEEQEAVNRAAERGVKVVKAHRKAIAKGLRAVEALLEELEAYVNQKMTIEEAIETAFPGKDNYKKRQQMFRAVSLQGMASTSVSLSSALKNLVALDRQAYNLGDKEDPEAAEIKHIVEYVD